MFPFYLTIGASLLLSLLFKVLADTYFVERVSLLGSWLGLHLTHNPGIAFGLEFGSQFQTLLIAVALGFVAYLAYTSERTALHQVGFGMIIGGAFANILDRLPDGVVTDFVRVFTFPVFNMADASITIGVILLLLTAIPAIRKHTLAR